MSDNPKEICAVPLLCVFCQLSDSLLVQHLDGIAKIS